MVDKFDYKKKYKDLYVPKRAPSIVDVPEMVFIAVDGRGDPNTCVAYKNAIEVLYGLSYAIKMSKMSGAQPVGYFEYVVPPLEGLWWVDDARFDGMNGANKDDFCWTAMIRQPEFVTAEVFEAAKCVLAKKKGAVDFSATRFISFTEGLCVQAMHIGLYDDEPATISAMVQFALENGYKEDISERRRHHEIYLSDPRKVSSENLKTVIRQPIARV